MSKRERIELIKQYIRAHGPSPWPDLAEFTKLSKATLSRLLSERYFTHTPMPGTTLYGITDAKAPETMEQLTNFLLMRLGRVRNPYGQMPYEEAETQAEVALNKLLAQFERLMRD